MKVIFLAALLLAGSPVQSKEIRDVIRRFAHVAGVVRRPPSLGQSAGQGEPESA